MRTRVSIRLRRAGGNARKPPARLSELDDRSGVCPGLRDCSRELGDGAYLDASDGSRAAPSHITDKQPLNFEAVGLILRLFPNAVGRLHVRRDPIETGLSIVSAGVQQALDLCPSAGRHRVTAYRRHERLIAHWESAFPGRILTVRYEDFASDFAPGRASARSGLRPRRGSKQCLEFQQGAGADFDIQHRSSARARLSI